MIESRDYADRLLTQNLSVEQTEELKKLLRIIYMTLCEQYDEQKIRPKV